MDFIHNPISGIQVENFTCFEDLNLQFAGGLNLFIGRNGVGKTHLLKLLYSVSHALEKYDDLSIEIQEKIMDSFFIEYVDSLCRNNSPFEVCFSMGDSYIKFDLSSGNDVSAETIGSDPFVESVIYIPPFEVMTNYRLYSSFESSIKLRLDSTYKYLATALNANPISNPELSVVSKIIDDSLKINLLKDNVGFYQVIDDKRIYASLMSDGIKKILTLKYLIDTDQIKKNTLLFIDEPETHLNPNLINEYVKVLVQLAVEGVQVFVSSHDYLLTYLLSLHAEYGKLVNVGCKFFSFFKESDCVKVECGDSLSSLQNNSIFNEYERLIDFENELFFNEKN